jgi:23S rRNA (guanosine2251-2'-O)-methyltransferase
MPRDRSRPPSDRSRSPGARSGGPRGSGPRKPGGPGGRDGDAPRKPRFGDGPKSPRGTRDDRPARGSRDDRPARGRTDERPARGRTDERPARGPGGDDRPRKPGGFGGKRFEDRPPRREGGEYRKPREGGEYRKPREGGERRFDDRGERSFGDKPFGDCKPRGDFDARKPGSRFDGDKPRSRFEDRPPRREGGEFRKPREGGEFRKPREGGEFRKPREGGEFRKPRGDFDDRKPRSRFDDRKPRSRFEDERPRAFNDEKPRARFEEPAAEAAPKRPKLGVAPTHLLYGLHAVRAALKNEQRTLKALYVTEAGLEALIGDDGIELTLEPELVEKDELDRLAPTGAVHQGALLVADPLPEVGIEDVIAGTADAEDVILVLIDQITDPQNVGAIMRSAAAFGAVAVIEHRRHGPEVTATVAKAASGAVELVPLVQVTNLARAIDDLKEAGFTCIGLAEEGEQPIGALDLKGKLALVIGAEGEGMRRLTIEKCNAVAVLPTAEDFSTLNASASAAIALYEARRQRSQ